MIEKFNKLIGFVALCAFGVLVVEVSPYSARYSRMISVLNIGVISLFIADVLLNFLVSRDKKMHLRRNWFDLIVFIPLIQFIQGIAATPVFVIIRQVVIVTMLLSRSRKAQRFLSLLSLRPAQLMVASFAFAITIGSILLMLPIASQGAQTSLVDAFFTATSATCVTGLVVQDTATHFSLFGQLVILALIQAGGLGIMTFSVSLALLFRKRVNMQQQRVMQDVLDNDTLSGVKNFIRFIFGMTFLIEAVGAAVLFFIWRDLFPGPVKTLYHAVFHSISAFCNAGFSTFSDSLVRFSYDLMTNITIGGLIILGGLGFIVIKDMGHTCRLKLTRSEKRPVRLRVQSRIVLKVTFILVLGGAGLIYAMETGHLFRDAALNSKVLMSFFQSITTRTAGFNTCDIARLSSSTLLLMILLMFIGASPGSTGGGIKTTTVSVLWATVVSAMRQKEHVEIGRRTIPYDIIQKAVTVLIFSLILIGLFTVALLYVEQKPFLDVVFESVSAFATVGLSTGITPALTVPGKVFIMLLMFIGRIGPLTVAYAFARYRAANYVYAEERVLIG